MRRVPIDLNRRARGGLSPARVTASRLFHLGEQVQVYEPEDEVVADGVVAEIDHERSTIYVAVDWSTLRDDASRTATAAEFESIVRSLTHRVSISRPTERSSTPAGPTRFFGSSDIPAARSKRPQAIEQRLMG